MDHSRPLRSSRFSSLKYNLRYFLVFDLVQVDSAGYLQLLSAFLKVRQLIVR